ncbi:MAG TPA: TIGR03668 family PPOX class F420-dependent oxidoreductase [Mycobacteriales bacterium]|nr:TIGR03668 family PPOX class F420-dependent oxidoreductase [Mycobacteriales bacterium]
MELAEEEARRRFAAGRVARLATVGAGGGPHLVPVTFAVRADVVVIAVDAKPKRSPRLARLRNIEATGLVSLLVDEYDEDWSRLWWARADGVARVLRADEDRAEPVGWLVAKYPQYAAAPPGGPVIWADVRVWRGWSWQ